MRRIILGRDLESKDWGTYIFDSNFHYHPLSQRPYNALRSQGVETLSQLASLTRAELLRFKNLGKRGIIEIEQLLAAEGISLL